MSTTARGKAAAGRAPGTPPGADAGSQILRIPASEAAERAVLGAVLAVLPFSAIAEGLPVAPHGAGTVLAVVALAAGGTLLPFTLFAYGQSRVSAELAGAFVNLEPLVGAIAGVALFGNPAGPVQAAGGTAIIAGIAMSSLPLLRPRRRPGQRAFLRCG